LKKCGDQEREINQYIKQYLNKALGLWSDWLSCWTTGVRLPAGTGIFHIDATPRQALELTRSSMQPVQRAFSRG